MEKASLRYLLSLCILLLSVFCQANAHTHKGGAFYAPLDKHEWLEYASLCNVQDDQATISQSYPSTSAKANTAPGVREVNEDEVEEEKSTSLKKRLLNSNYFTAALSALTREYLFCNTTSLLFSKHFSFISYRLHLIIQVFRI